MEEGSRSLKGHGTLPPAILWVHLQRKGTVPTKAERCEAQGARGKAKIRIAICSTPAGVGQELPRIGGPSPFPSPQRGEGGGEGEHSFGIWSWFRGKLYVRFGCFRKNAYSAGCFYYCRRGFALDRREDPLDRQTPGRYHDQKREVYFLLPDYNLHYHQHRPDVVVYSVSEVIWDKLVLKAEILGYNLGQH